MTLCLSVCLPEYLFVCVCVFVPFGIVAKLLCKQTVLFFLLYSLLYSASNSSQKDMCGSICSQEVISNGHKKRKILRILTESGVRYVCGYSELKLVIKQGIGNLWEIFWNLWQIFGLWCKKKL